MPSLHAYKIFISHAWKYGESYNRILEMLDGAANISYINYSAPEDKPLNIDDSARVHEVKEAITNKIRPVECVVVLSGMYTAYSKWMQYEIDEAVRLGKYIVGVRPWGSSIVPKCVADVADEIVGWNTDSIVSAIRNCL